MSDKLKFVERLEFDDRNFNSAARFRERIVTARRRVSGKARARHFGGARAAGYAADAAHRRFRAPQFRTGSAEGHTSSNLGIRLARTARPVAARPRTKGALRASHAVARAGVSPTNSRARR